jgi:hypothetical protein
MKTKLLFVRNPIYANPSHVPAYKETVKTVEIVDTEYGQSVRVDGRPFACSDIETLKKIMQGSNDGVIMHSPSWKAKYEVMRLDDTENSEETKGEE